ncbi:alpha/beta fold hydrolase [Gilvimarinus sp. SDUM040013]|uniref:Proline iminopeptidase n=1 Tax=Gilvimarinus gilvus TaxID=3058038 RepID=A0ABU4S6I1_9GAMM|nr:alpha/beta fold hydrolase [Gilvimarinus sp. SDUM040013]MDO3388066.1 alpha/beta fold hydrolase [Gilvimarinus sp. SDUM040013]MDX6850974.1 alpha/beta fold hydrolase [Gilvimarinus sp. SDUM040013]
MSIRFVCFIILINLIPHANAEPNWQPHTLTGPNGEQVPAELGYIETPQIRGKADSGTLELGFVRLKSQAQNPGNPIVYLAGGPGGSATWTASHQRHPMFVALTEFADVIIFDQRGTGLSRNGLEDCRYDPKIPLTQAITLEGYINAMSDAARYCRKQWSQTGVDLNAYNTMESVHDLEALRVALGAEQIDLWGISYGTHLAFAMNKTYPQSVGKMILASSEGLDHTIKSPANVDAVLARVATAFKAHPASAQYPELVPMMQGIHEKYAAEPATIKVPTRDGATVELAVSKANIQLMTAGALLRDPSSIANLPGFYGLLAMGDFSLIGPHFLGMRMEMFTLNPMSVAMDAASGVSQERWQQVQGEAERSVLWRSSNLPFPDISAALGVKDLGDDFRSLNKNATPTLFFAGTLDGRTPLEGQRDVANYFSNKSFVTIENGGHNLYMSSPKVLATMQQFLRGETLAEEITIELPIPEFR